MENASRKSALVKGIGSVGLVLALAACSSPAEAGGSDDPILIGIPVGLTGANSVIAPGVVQASELAAKEINEAGGVLGRQIELKIYDDQSGAAGALKAFTAATQNDKVTGIVGMETTAARNAGQPVAAQTNTPYIYTSSYEGAACASNLFINGSVPTQSVDPLVEWIGENIGATKYALIASDYAFGRETGAYLEEVVAAAGSEMVSMQYNPMDSGDWTSILNQIQRAQPDVVVSILAGGTPSVTLTKQWTEMGITIPHYSLGIDEETATTVGANAAGIRYPAAYFTGSDSPENKAFLAALEEEFGSEAHTPNQLTVPQYEGVHLMAKAIEKAGSTDPDAILEAIPTVAYDGPSGTVQINEQHHAALAMYLGEVQQDGTTVVIDDFGMVSPGAQCPDLS